MSVTSFSFQKTKKGIKTNISGNNEISDMSLVEKANELEKLKEHKPKQVLSEISRNDLFRKAYERRQGINNVQPKTEQPIETPQTEELDIERAGIAVQNISEAFFTFGNIEPSEVPPASSETQNNYDDYSDEAKAILQRLKEQISDYQ